MRVWNPYPLSKYGARLVLDQQQAPVRLVASDFLHDVEKVDGREKVSEGITRNGHIRMRGNWKPQLVDFRKMSHIGPVGFRLLYYLRII